MGWEIKPAREAFPAFATEWDRLNAELYGSHPVFDSRFVGPLLECFSDGSERLCIHRKGRTADGALILQPRGIGRWALFLPGQAQAGALMLRDVQLFETLFGALPGFAWTIDLLALDPLYCPDWCNLRLPRTVTPHALTMAVSITGTFDDYWQTRPRHLASNMRRYQRRTAERFDAASIVTLSAPSQIEAAIARYGALEMSGWKGKTGTAVNADNDQGKFYRDILIAFASSDQAKVIELHIGGMLAASRLIIHNKRMWVMLKTAYDETLAAHAPGRQLLYATLEQAFHDMPDEMVEFYTNTTRDQAEWATSLRFVRHNQIYRGRLWPTLHRLAVTLMKMARKPLEKKTPNNMVNPVSEKVSSGPTVDGLPASALRLIETFASRNSESSPEWFDNLQKTVFPDDPGVRYYVAEFDKSPVAVLPLRLADNGWIRRIEALGNFYTSLYMPIVVPHCTALELMPLLKQADSDHGGAHVMHLSPLDPMQPSYEALLTALRTNGWIPFRFFCFGNWYLNVDKPWSAYLRERDGKLRSTIKRMGKKFAYAGGTLEIITAPENTEAAIQAFDAVYARSWKIPEPYPGFIPGLIRWLASKGQLRLGIARLNGHPIAAQLWIVAGDKASIFKLAYDEAVAAYSPGTLLTAHLMEHVIDRDGVAEVDYLIGDDEHKKSWMSHRRERWGIVAYNPKTVMGLALLIREIIGRTTRKVIQMIRPDTSKSAQATRWEIVPIARFSEYAAQWDALQRSCANLPFLESAFLQPLLEEFGTGREILALAYADEKPCAAAIVTRKRPGIWQTFQPSQLPLGAWVSAGTPSIADLGKSLLHALPGFNLSLSLTQIDPQFQPRPNDRPCIRTIDYIETAWVDIDQPFDSYWEARGKNLKTNMRKQRTKLQSENVSPSLECITSPAGVAQAVDDYGTLESTGWKGKDGTAVHPGNAQGRFYRKTLENFCAQRRGRIYRYRFNDKVVAMDLCIESRDRVVILKTAYDETFKSVSPSTLMRQDEFRELFNTSGLKRIEFYGKVMEWHTRWTDNARVLYHITIYRRALLQRLHARYNAFRSRNNAEHNEGNC